MRSLQNSYLSNYQQNGFPNQFAVIILTDQTVVFEKKIRAAAAIGTQ